MTTNISECFNGVLKGARGLPIAALVEFTWNKLVQYFYDRRKEYHYELSKGKKWSQYALSTWNGNKCKSEKHYLKPSGNKCKSGTNSMTLALTQGSPILHFLTLV